MRQIHYNEGELFTTFHDRPDGHVIEVSVRDE